VIVVATAAVVATRVAPAATAAALAKAEPNGGANRRPRFF